MKQCPIPSRNEVLPRECGYRSNFREIYLLDNGKRNRYVLHFDAPFGRRYDDFVQHQTVRPWIALCDRGTRDAGSDCS